MPEFVVQRYTNGCPSLHKQWRMIFSIFVMFFYQLYENSEWFLRRLVRSAFTLSWASIYEGFCLIGILTNFYQNHIQMLLIFLSTVVCLFIFYVAHMASLVTCNPISSIKSLLIVISAPYYLYFLSYAKILSSTISLRCTGSITMFFVFYVIFFLYCSPNNFIHFEAFVMSFLCLPLFL